MNKTEVDDEIDLYKLIHTLWSGKWVIALFGFTSLLVAFGYLTVLNSKLPKAHVHVSAKYSIEAISNSVKNLCMDDSACSFRRMNVRFLDFVDDTWKGKNKVSEEWIKLGFSDQLVANCYPKPKFGEYCIEQRTTPSLGVDYYYQQLENSIEKFQENLLSEVQQELSFLKKEAASGLLLSIDELRNLSNLVINIQKKNMPIKVKDVKITTVKPNLKETKISMFFLALGLFLGSGFILLRSSLEKG